MAERNRRYPPPAPSDEAAAQFAGRLLSRWRVLLGVPSALAVLVVGVGLILPRRYTAQAAFVADVPARNEGTLAGVAARFGVAVGPGQALDSPQLYAELARSDHVLRQVVTTPLGPAGSPTAAGTLVRHYELSSGDALRDRDLAVRRLRGELTVAVSTRTGIVRLSSRQRSAELAAAVVGAVLREVSASSIEARRHQAGAERAFVEQRLGVAQEELQAAEAQVERFLEANREYRAAPRLVLEHERLQRVVALRQSLVMTLATALEEARIDEVRGTPVITVIEPPAAPALADPRLLLFKALGAFGVGILAVGGVVVYGPAWRDALRAGRRSVDG